jgi:hypothetical protein
MKPIKNFTDHPTLKYDQDQYIFITNENSVYLFTEKIVQRIYPVKAVYTNLGDPYRKLARIYFLYYFCPRKEEQSIDIDLDDLLDLIRMLQAVGLNIPLDKDLQKYIKEEND